MSGRISAIAARNEERQDDRVRRRGERRGVAVARRRHDVQAGLRRSPVQSIGAIAIDPSNPRTVWVGTGESWTRNSVSRSATASTSRPTAARRGRTWACPSPSASTRIVVDPKNGDVVYACVPGQALERQRRARRLQDDRRRQDAGASSSRERTCRPAAPVSRWTRRTRRCSSPACGTSAARAGRSARAATGPTRRAAARSCAPPTAERRGRRSPPRRTRACRRGRGAASRSRSRRPTRDVVYALVESADSALYRSDDGGSTWQARDKSQGVVWRPFYFAQLVVDPKNPDRVFKPGLDLVATRGRRAQLQLDRRRLARRLARPLDRSRQHAARHRRRRRRALDLVGRRQPLVEGEQPADLAVLPREPRRQGPLQRLRRPAGQQLVGRARRPRRAGSRTRSGRTSTAATASGRSSTRPTRTSSTPSRRAATSGASTGRTGVARDIQPKAGYGEKLRFNWNAPIHASPTQKGTIYIGAQFLFRSRDRGDTWERISPDLTTNDPEKQKQEESGGVTVDNSSAEMHTTIYSISESPKDAQVIWVGTDDGNVQLTRDGGKTWTNVAGERARPAAGVVGELGRGEPLRRGRRVRRVRPPHVRRHDAVGLPDGRLREDLDADRLARAGRPRLRALREGGRREADAPLRRHRARALDLGRRRATWAAFKGGDFPSGRGARGAGPPARARPRDRDARPRHLDRGRHHAAARARATTSSAARRRSFPAGPVAAAAAGPRRVGRGRRGVRRAEPAGRRRDHVLPEDAAPLRPAAARGARRVGQGPRDDPGDQAARAQPRRRGRCGSRRRACRAPRRSPSTRLAGAARRPRAVHGAPDEGRGDDRDEARRRPRPRAPTSTSPAGRCSSTRRCACTRSSAA